MSNDRYPLHQVILDDLTSHNKLPLLLFFAIIMTALATLWVTHQTRLLVVEQDRLWQVQRKLENQYIYLQVEENKQSNSNKVEENASNIGLQRVQKNQEVILVK